jgi:hypothetical protein
MAITISSHTRETSNEEVSTDLSDCWESVEFDAAASTARQIPPEKRASSMTSRSLGKVIDH